MLRIEEGSPWAMWPNNLVDNFIDNPANKIFDHEGDFVFNLVFELVEPITKKSCLFAKLPSYAGIDLDHDGISFLFTCNGVTDYRFTTYAWEVGTKYELLIVKVNNQLGISLNGVTIVTLNLESKLDGDDNSHLVFGAGNFPKNGFNLNYTNLILHKLVILRDKELIAEHDFDIFIHNKSFDKTGNCNFIHKI